MRPTRFGVQAAVFHVALVGAFFAAPYANLYFLLLGFLTLLGLQGIAAARRNVRGVTAELAELPPVPAGGAVEVPVRLGAARRARYGVAALVELAGGQRLEGRLDVLDGEASLALAATGLPRGVHTVRSARVESVHPFGLVRVARPFDAPGELVVYPAPRGLGEGRGADASVEELLGHARPGAGDLQPAGLRDHREGDGVRGIHWRASARRGRLVMQEWEGGSGHGLEVVLDRRCEQERLEEALATISAIVHVARAGKETLRIQSQGLAATYGEGQLPWADALRFLAGAEALPADAPPPPPAGPSVARLPDALGQERTP